MAIIGLDIVTTVLNVVLNEYFILMGMSVYISYLFSGGLNYKFGILSFVVFTSLMILGGIIPSVFGTILIIIAGFIGALLVKRILWN